MNGLQDLQVALQDQLDAEPTVSLQTDLANCMGDINVTTTTFERSVQDLKKLEERLEILELRKKKNKTKLLMICLWGHENSDEFKAILAENEEAMKQLNLLTEWLQTRL